MHKFVSHSISNDKTKCLFTPWKLGSIKMSKYWFNPSVDNFVWYLFQLIVLLKPDFNCCNSFALSWIDKVIAGKDSFACAILNFAIPVAEEITQSSDQVKMRLISQLINGISRVLQKLLKYFNDTAISTSFVFLAARDFPVVLVLCVND